MTNTPVPRFGRKIKIRSNSTPQDTRGGGRARRIYFFAVAAYKLVSFHRVYLGLNSGSWSDQRHMPLLMRTCSTLLACPRVLPQIEPEYSMWHRRAASLYLVGLCSGWEPEAGDDERAMK